MCKLVSEPTLHIFYAPGSSQLMQNGHTFLQLLLCACGLNFYIYRTTEDISRLLSDYKYFRLPDEKYQFWSDNPTA